MEEIFKDIPDYEGLYQVSNIGRIKSFNGKWGKGKVSGNIIKTFKDKEGRIGVVLCKDGIPKKRWLVHRLVLITFEGYSPDPEKWQVNHLDGNPSNNNLKNLEWETPKGNIQHSYDVLGRIAASTGKKYISGGAKKIDAFDLQGNFIQTFLSGSQAVDVLGGKITKQGVSACVKGRANYHNGYIFKYHKIKDN